MAWILTTPEAADRDVVSTVPVNIDRIRLVKVALIAVPRPAMGATILMNVTVQYGLQDGGFVVMREENHRLNEASTLAVINTPTTSGKLGPNLEQAIFDELAAQGVIPAGS